jgi:Domain of unknown function (DUF4335)
MSIRRQYSLPNCTLILDGMGNSSRATNEQRPLMSSLINAECHVSGQKQHISGGLDFFQQLITVVSNYTQGLLSKIINETHTQQVGRIRLEKGHEHRLVAQSDQGEIDWQLSTVQLFDLTEAIDQFLADGSTLPDLLVGIQPAPKAASNKIATQAAPLGLGLSGLAATAMAFYLMPAPIKVAPTPEPVPAVSTAPVKTETKSETKPSPTTSTAAATDAVDPNDSKINRNPTQVAFIERKLRRDINLEWADRKGISDKLEYKVAANSEGQIVNYEAKNASAKSLQDRIPLPKMVPSPNAETTEKLAEYNVSFTPNGAIEIKRSKLLKGDPTLGKEIKDADKVKTLAADLNAKVQLKDKPTFKQDLNYRVAADEGGVIVDYEPIDQPAFDYEKETPLPQVTKYDAEAAAGEKPLAQYTVTYQPNGMVKVNPRK